MSTGIGIELSEKVENEDYCQAEVKFIKRIIKSIS